MEEKKVDIKSKDSDKKIMAVIATLPFISVLMYYGMKNLDSYTKHYAKQGIAVSILLILHFLLYVVGVITSFLFIGVFIFCLNFLLAIVIFVLWIMLAINALQGEMYSIPYVSKYVDDFLKE